jgi:hypothetical protein
MLSILQSPSQLCDGISRRELMRIGALAGSSLSLPTLLQAGTQNAPAFDRAFGQAKNIIFLYLAGGPPQHETFDPKPDAPVGIRGPFDPISTNVPGIHVCELLPRTAALADKLAIVRSMATNDNIHSSSGAWVLTGYKYRGPNARTISPTDWPYYGSVVKMLKPSEQMPALSTVWIPDRLRLNESVTPAGQTGGFLGSQWTPEVFVGDPADPSYEIESLRRTDVSTLHLSRRKSLLAQLEDHRNGNAFSGTAYDTYQQQAFDLLTSGTARTAFEIDREPTKVRDRYGRNRWGQCVLLARRMIEAGVRLVHVQWPREPGDNAVDNPLWDTHAQNADRVEDVLCPMFDVGYSALIEDLDQRGLLDETLVVAIGEFGRTPKINAKGGRDHWGSVFSFTLAGAGISGGQVYGSSDKTGGFPVSQRVQPGDLTATIFHLLGIDSQGSFPDRLGRLHRLTDGEPLMKLLGSEPATLERIKSTGDVARVPPFDPTRFLLKTNFAGENVLQTVTAPSRPKGWRAHPDPTAQANNRIEVRLDQSSSVPGENGTTVTLGLHTDPAASETLRFSQNAMASITQEVRSPFAGRFTLRVKLRAEGASREWFETVFLKHFTCRLAFLQFNNQKKNALEARQLSAVNISPKFHEAGRSTDAWQTFELTSNFENPRPGSNFSFGSGLAVSVQLVKTSGGTLRIPESDIHSTFIRIWEVSLEFSGKKRNPNVKV